jgi:adenosine deaminase
MINTDDPGMFMTDLNREYLAVAEAFDLSNETLSQIAANGFSHCWTAEGQKAGAPLHA